MATSPCCRTRRRRCNPSRRRQRIQSCLPTTNSRRLRRRMSRERVATVGDNRRHRPGLSSVRGRLPSAVPLHRVEPQMVAAAVRLLLPGRPVGGIDSVQLSPNLPVGTGRRRRTGVVGGRRAPPPKWQRPRRHRRRAIRLRSLLLGLGTTCECRPSRVYVFVAQ